MGLGLGGERAPVVTADGCQIWVDWPDGRVGNRKVFAKWLAKRDSSNFEIEWDRMLSVPGSFKLEYLQPFEPVVLQKI